MKVVSEETFGAVIPVMAYEKIENAIDIANDTIYGM